MKFIAMLMSTVLLLCSCSNNSLHTTIDKNLVEQFTTIEQYMIEEYNPDLVDINYLESHLDDYVSSSELEADSEIVIVKGTITDVKIEDNNELVERIEQSENISKATIPFLENTISYDVYLDNNTELSLSSIKDNNETLEFNKGEEYYFFVNIYDLLSDENYSVMILSYCQLDK